MSQNQSYFWQTTRHNVYLKRSAKLQMLLALLAVLTFSTICLAEMDSKPEDDTGVIMDVPAKINLNSKQYEANIEPVSEHVEKEPTKETKTSTGFIDAFSASISVILFTELGDKTFFIAAIMAMRHPRLIVFAGAISALALMTVLSVVFGMAATIIPKVYTYYISTALFAIFGLKMIYEGYFMKDTDAQEELEGVQSEVRKREDELLRSNRNKHDDGDAKRKNSNSDKEDDGAGAGNSTKMTHTSLNNHPEMQHRQRKQLNNNNISNNNNNLNSCDVNNEDIDSDDGRHERDVFLEDGVLENNVKMSTFHSSPALSTSVHSNQTEQTNCDEFTHSPSKLNFKANTSIAGANDDIGKTLTEQQKHGSLTDLNTDLAVMVHSSTASATLMNHKKNGIVASASSNSINSISNLSINSNGGVVVSVAGGQPKSELKQLGGSKKRLERSASVVQDPESGVIRKNVKKSATYFTTRVLMQAFTMTFLAEWGDRSQLTTIILAASKNVYGVITGGVLGHAICTGLAVVGGRMVAAKISVRTVTILGGIVFLGFAMYALIVRPDDI